MAKAIGIFVGTWLLSIAMSSLVDLNGELPYDWDFNIILATIAAAIVTLVFAPVNNGE